MNLGELHAAFYSLADVDFVFSEAFNDVMSYRGYYNEVAFEPAVGIRLGVIKSLISRAFTEEFTGYKGGEYRYDSNTPVHLSYYSSADDADGFEFEALVGRMLVEYNTAQPIDNNT